jgi:mannose-6-phosphate isomerase-like protein (cupin superfamily)
MFIRKLKKCRAFTAGDGCVLRELLHPGKAPLKFRYSLAYAKVRPGRKTAPHKLKTSEVYYILKGKGLMSIDGKTSKVSPGCAIYIPPRSIQNIKNTGKRWLEFLCIVDPAWRQEDEEVF